MSRLGYFLHVTPPSANLNFQTPLKPDRYVTAFIVLNSHLADLRGVCVRRGGLGLDEQAAEDDVFLGRRRQRVLVEVREVELRRVGQPSRLVLLLLLLLLHKHLLLLLLLVVLVCVHLGWLVVVEK